MPVPRPDGRAATKDQLVYVPWVASQTPGAVVPATPRFFSAGASPFRYDDQAQRPDAWLAFLGTIWPDDPDAVACLQEVFGYLLTPDLSLQKIFLFVGPSRSGKGTIRQVLTELVGEASVLSSSPARLAERFELSAWLGKTIAVMPDCRISGRTDPAQVAEKLLSISGADPVGIERKYLSNLNVRLQTRIVMFSNELPQVRDASGALAARFVVLRMTRSFLGKEDTGLESRLRAELPGIFWWALMGLLRLRERGRFTVAASARDLVEEIDDLTSPVGAFLREQCQTGVDLTADRDDIWKAWRAWCEENNHAAGTRQQFGRQLHAAVPGLRTVRPRVGGTLTRRYVGLRLTNSTSDTPIPD